MKSITGTMVFLLCVVMFFFYVPCDALGCALFCGGYSFFLSSLLNV